MDKRSRVGSPWDCKELDMTEQLSLSLGLNKTQKTYRNNRGEAEIKAEILPQV